MIKSTEIKSKAQKKYISFLTSIVQGNHFERIVLPCDKKPSEDLLTYEKEMIDILSGSTERKGYGYHIKWQTVCKKSIGKQDIPQEISFETEHDFLKYLKKETEVRCFRNTVKETLQQFPELQEWMALNPVKVVSNLNSWRDICKVLAYFKATPCPHLYIRELPIEVHTKFIEKHEGILKELLNIVIADDLNPNETKFAKRFHLREKEFLVRLRCLDASLADAYFRGIEELAVPVSQLEAFGKRVQAGVFPSVSLKRVFIVENEINFLTFPRVKDSIILWGRVFDVCNLKNLSLLHDVELYYWGDFDVHGFEILSQCRGYFPHTVSLLMDRETFVTYFQADEGKPSTLTTAELHLNEEEKELYDQLKDHNWRLEQEKIPQSHVVEVMEQLHLLS